MDEQDWNGPNDYNDADDRGLRDSEPSAEADDRPGPEMASKPDVNQIEVGVSVLETLTTMERHKEGLLLQVSTLRRLESIPNSTWPEESATVAACAIGNLRFPPVDPDGAVYKVARRRVEGMRTPDVISVTTRFIARELGVINAAIRGLEALDAIGESLPATWHNLPLWQLAREINARGLNIFRGRIPGFES